MFRDIVKFLDVIRKIIGILDKKDKKKSLLVLVDILLCAVLETLGVGIIVPFISVVADENKLYQYSMTKYVMDFFSLSVSQIIIIMMIGIIVFYFAKNIFLMFSSYIQNVFRFRLQKKLSVKMLNAYMERPYQFFVDTNSSVIIRGIGNDIGCVKDALGTLFDLVTQLLTLIMIAAFLAYTDLGMAIGLLIVSLLCMYLLVVVLRRKIGSLGREEREADQLVTKYSFEILEGIKEILAMRKQGKFVDMYSDAFGKKGKIEAKYVTLLAFPNRVIETVFMSGIIIILFVRMTQGADINTLVPQLAAFALGGIKMLPAMSSVSRAVSQIIFQKPGVDEAYDNIIEVNRNNANKKDDENVIESFEKLKLEDVHWKYAGSENEVINGVSFDINRGESIALIGASGSGKTTLVDIILGLFVPQKGKITVNGIDLDSCKDSWSKNISYVQQNIFLIDDTIRNNVAFGVDSKEIDDNKIWEALRKAQLSEFVESLEEGLDTIVGERGVKFSGGQRQRIAIARALYFGTQILIFDEATAALDNKTEKDIIESIDALHGEKTMVIVAHRLSTVANCDKIYEVRAGKIVERKKAELFSE